MSKKREKIKLPDGSEIEIEVEDVFGVLPHEEEKVSLKDLLTKFDRVYDNQKGFQYKIKGTFGEEGFFTREEAEQRYEKMKGKLIYQKGLEPGQVQTEFEAKKTIVKPLGKVTDVKPTKKTELDFFGMETSDRPHLESFDKPVDVTDKEKRLGKLFDDINECFYRDNEGHVGKCASGDDLHTLLGKAEKILKTIPPLKPDEEIVECKKKTMEKAKKFASYVRDDYNKDRHIMATLGSFGITFDDDVKELLHGLRCIGEDKIAEEIKKNIK